MKIWDSVYIFNVIKFFVIKYYSVVWFQSNSQNIPGGRVSRQSQTRRVVGISSSIKITKTVKLPYENLNYVFGKTKTFANQKE